VPSPVLSGWRKRSPALGVPSRPDYRIPPAEPQEAAAWLGRADRRKDLEHLLHPGAAGRWWQLGRRHSACSPWMGCQRTDCHRCGRKLGRLLSCLCCAIIWTICVAHASRWGQKLPVADRGVSSPRVGGLLELARRPRRCKITGSALIRSQIW